jgi:hypothetical protein
MMEIGDSEHGPTKKHHQSQERESGYQAREDGLFASEQASANQQKG